MKALILVPFDPRLLEKLSQNMDIVYRNWMETKKLVEPEELIHYTLNEGVQIVVIEADFIFKEVLESTSNLRFVGVCRSTVNNVDIESATQQGVLVVNTPARNSIAVAELTLGLALSLARRIPEAHTAIKSGEWRDPVEPYITMRGTELDGKIAGIIGFGSIGKEVARRFQAFGMEVIACDPYIEPDIIQKDGVAPTDLNTLLKEADFISIHCSTREQTGNLLGKEQFKLIKPTAFLINTASWEIMDEKALFQALDTHSIAGAAFDVFAGHPLSSGSPLLKMNNVILTPHIGGATDGTIKKYSQMMAEDILRFINGKRPLHLLNPEVWDRNGK